MKMERRISVGCQTITWGPEKNRNAIGEVIKEVAAAGYEGVEIGARHLDLARPQDFKQILDENGLKLVALHIGGDFLNPQSVASDRSRIDEVLDFLAALGSEYLAISGIRKDSAALEEFRKEAVELDRLGATCRARDIKLCYHNHYWEIENNVAGLRLLCEGTDPANVSLALDVGWVERAGGSPVDVFQEFINRIGYIHFKDTKDGEFIEVGQGTVDFRGIMKVLQSVSKEWWIVTEQDTTRRLPFESVKMSRDYLRDTFGL